MGKRIIKFQVPDRMFEEFFKLFPEMGERSRFLRRIVSLALQRRKLKDQFEREIERQATWKGGKDESP